MKKKAEYEPSGASASKEPVTIKPDFSSTSTDDILKSLSERTAGIPPDQDLDEMSCYEIDELRKRQLHDVTIKIAEVAWRNHCLCTSRDDAKISEKQLLDWYRRGLAKSRQQTSYDW